MHLKISLRKIVLLMNCLLVSTLFTYGQQHPVIGHILSAEDQKPLPGATIKIKGMSRQTLTNPDGSFSITANNDDILIVTSVGYTTRELKAGDDLGAIALLID